MAGLFGNSRRGGPGGLFEAPRDFGQEQQRLLADLAAQFGGSSQSVGLPEDPFREMFGKGLAPPQAPFVGGGGSPFEPPRSALPFTTGLAGFTPMLGAAGGGLKRPSIGGGQNEPEGYADQIAQRGTPEWGDTVRDFLMQGPSSSDLLSFHSDEEPADGGFGTAAENDHFGFGQATTQSGEFEQKDREAEGLRSAAPYWEGEVSPRRFMRPVAFQEGFDRAQERAVARQRAQDRAIAQQQAKRTSGNAGASPQQRVSPVPVRPTHAQPGNAPPNPNAQRVLTPRELLKSRIRLTESTNNDRAVNSHPNSSAAGRYQFTDDNWVEMHRQIYGGDGLNDKFNPEKQERIMDARLDRYEATLRRNNFEPTARNLYLVHFAGPTGALRLLRNPNKPVEALLSRDAVRGNPHIKGKTAAQVIEYADRKINGDPPKAQPSRGRTRARVPRR
jgi:hypothetical protein